MKLLPRLTDAESGATRTSTFPVGAAGVAVGDGTPGVGGTPVEVRTDVEGGEDAGVGTAVSDDARVEGVVGEATGVGVARGAIVAVGGGFAVGVDAGVAPGVEVADGNGDGVVGPGTGVFVPQLTIATDRTATMSARDTYLSIASPLVIIRPQYRQVPVIDAAVIVQVGGRVPAAGPR